MHYKQKNSQKPVGKILDNDNKEKNAQKYIFIHIF